MITIKIEIKTSKCNKQMLLNISTFLKELKDNEVV